MENDMGPDDERDLTKIVDTEIKSGVLDIYEDLLMTVWAKILPTLGTVTVVTIVQRAVSRTSEHHPSLTNLTVTDSGISLSKLRDKISEEQKEELKDGFKELIANLFDILAKLTGNIIVQQLIKEVDGLEMTSEDKK